MPLLPPIPKRPADRPETLAEYRSRRAVIAMHRQTADDFARWVNNIVPERVPASGLLDGLLVGHLYSVWREAIDDELYNREFAPLAKKEPE